VINGIQPSLSADELKPTLKSSGKGEVKNTIQNCLTVFQQDRLLQGAICHNALTERVDIVKPLGWNRTTPPLTDTDMRYIQLYFENNYGLIVESKIDNAIRIVANENEYHPICDYLTIIPLRR